MKTTKVIKSPKVKNSFPKPKAKYQSIDLVNKKLSPRRAFSPYKDKNKDVTNG